MSAKATTLKVSKHTDLTGTSTGYKVFAVIVLILVALFFLFPLYWICLLYTSPSPRDCS